MKKGEKTKSSNYLILKGTFKHSANGVEENKQTT